MLSNNNLGLPPIFEHKGVKLIALNCRELIAWVSFWSFECFI